MADLNTHVWKALAGGKQQQTQVFCAPQHAHTGTHTQHRHSLAQIAECRCTHTPSLRLMGQMGLPPPPSTLPPAPCQPDRGQRAYCHTEPLCFYLLSVTVGNPRHPYKLLHIQTLLLLLLSPLYFTLSFAWSIPLPPPPPPFCALTRLFNLSHTHNTAGHQLCHRTAAFDWQRLKVAQSLDYKLISKRVFVSFHIYVFHSFSL